ncbi:uncharacterized protein DMENIID0001_153500 [Sergentomyia squamirostris]
MCLLKENPNSESVWKNFFAKPIMPKLPRQIVRSARVNLNKYWHKFEDMIAAETTYLMSTDESQNHLNNQHEKHLQNITARDLTDYMNKSLRIEKNLQARRTTLQCDDDTLYHGINLNCKCKSCWLEEDDNQQNELLELLQHPIYNINFNFK